MLRTAQPQQSHEPGRNARHPALATYVYSSLPVQATALCTHAPLRVAVPTTALLPLRRSQRPRPSGSGRCVVCALPTQAVRAHARRPIVWRMHARSTRSLRRAGCCLQPAVVESADAHVSISNTQLPRFAVEFAAPPLHVQSIDQHDSEQREVLNRQERLPRHRLERTLVRPTRSPHRGALPVPCNVLCSVGRVGPLHTQAPWEEQPEV
jgi:hypothetical protein